MTIETKYNIGQEVWFMWDNKPTCQKIAAMEVYVGKQLLPSYYVEPYEIDPIKVVYSDVIPYNRRFHEQELLDEKETYYIAKYNPKYNKVIPHAYSPKNIKYLLLTKYGVRTRKRDIELWICDNVEECYFFKGERCINESDFQKCLTYFAGNKI